MIKNIIGIIVVGIIVLVAVIYGFTSSGSPMHVRAVKFDAQRLSDINTLKYSIQYYYSTNNKLPSTLEDAKTSYYGNSSTPVDPETKKPYSYEPGAGIDYKLCTTFSSSNMGDSDIQKNNYNYYGSNLEHPKGYHCFDFAVTPTPTPYNYYNYSTPTPYRYLTPTPTPTASTAKPL